MTTESRPKSTSAAVAGRSSSIAPLSRGWQSRSQLAILIVATALCVSMSTKSGSNPLVICAILLAAALGSIAGFAFSAVCGAMLFHLSADTVLIVQIMIVCSVVNQTAMVWSLKRAIRWRELSVFLTGGAVGLPVGVTVLLKLDHHVYTHVLGVFLVLYGCYMLARRPLVIRRQMAVFDALAGFLGGVTGGAAAFPSAFVTIWCGFKGWNKERQRAMFQPFILIMQVAALAIISVLRHSAGKAGFDPAILLCIPGSLLGTTIGMTVFKRLSDNQFARAVNLLLIVSGVSYLG